jgi:hypothetical protein
MKDVRQDPQAELARLQRKAKQDAKAWKDMSKIIAKMNLRDERMHAPESSFKKNVGLVRLATKVQLKSEVSAAEARAYEEFLAAGGYEDEDALRSWEEQEMFLTTLRPSPGL